MGDRGPPAIGPPVPLSSNLTPGHFLLSTFRSFVCTIAVFWHLLIIPRAGLPPVYLPYLSFLGVLLWEWTRVVRFRGDCCRAPFSPSLSAMNFLSHSLWLVNWQKK